MENIADKIFTKLGGPAVAAGATGVAVQTAYRWSYPKERGGTGGVIPAKYHQILLDFSSKSDLPLKHSDFFNST